MQPRIWRPIARAGWSQLTRACSGVTFGARLTPSAGCSLAFSAPDSIPSRVATSRPAPEEASRPSSVPAVSSSRTGSVTMPYTGPASSSRTSRKVVAPVMSSPAMIARWTGAAPRHAGSSEKCRFTQPCAGMARTSSGISAP